MTFLEIANAVSATGLGILAGIGICRTLAPPQTQEISLTIEVVPSGTEEPEEPPEKGYHADDLPPSWAKQLAAHAPRQRPGAYNAKTGEMMGDAEIEEALGPERAKLYRTLGVIPGGRDS